MMVTRRETVRLYPSKKQTARLEQTAAMHCELYNAALQHRRDAYRLAKKSVGHTEQTNMLREVKRVRPEFCGVTQMCMNATLRRLDRAYAAFFRRVKNGQTPGFPRYKSRRRYRGWDYPRHGNGCKVQPNMKLGPKGVHWRDGTIYLQNIGKMRFRGKTSGVGEIRCVTIRRQAQRWFASIVVLRRPNRAHGHEFLGVDWGVTDYATVASACGRYDTIANDRLFQAQQEEARAKQKAASKTLRGRRSHRAKKKHLQVARAHAKLANQRKHRSHTTSARLVARARLIALETLNVANLTRSAKGTQDKPGKNVAQKSGLNREILDTAPGMLAHQIRYKAAEAGVDLVVIDSRRHKPSQTCPQCDAVVKKTLAERQHRCGCGFEATRDQSAALVILKRALEHYGRKPAGGDAPENSTQNGAAVWVE